MKITFNSLGVVTETITNDEPLRQGNVNNTCTATFQGKNNVNFNAYIYYTRSDNAKVEGTPMLPDANDPTKYHYTFSDAWFFAKAGTTNATIKLVNGQGTVVCSGTIQFSIEQTEVVNDPTITITQYNALLTAIALKLAITNGIIAVANISGQDADDFTTGQLFVCKTTNKIYIVKETDGVKSFDVWHLSEYLLKTGGTMTGDLGIAGTSDTPLGSHKLNFYDHGSEDIKASIERNAGSLLLKSKVGQNYKRYLLGSNFSCQDNGDLGNTGMLWKDLYLSGYLKDGTKSLKINELVDTINDQDVDGLKKFQDIPETKAGRTYDSQNQRQIVDYQLLSTIATALQNDIDEEESDREDADNTLLAAINLINGKIPSGASSENQLADKDFVNSSINALASFYITKNVAKEPFSTYAELSSATTFYSNGVERVPTQNDYCMVNADETHNGAACRYIFQGTYGQGGGWNFQFVVNNAPFTAAQIAAINSGITALKVAAYDGVVTSVGNILSGNTVVPKATGDKYGRDITEFYQEHYLYVDITILNSDWVANPSGGYDFTTANLKSTLGVLTAGDLSIFVPANDEARANFDAYGITCEYLGTTGTGEQAVTTATIHAINIGSGTGEVPIPTVNVRLCVFPEANHSGSNERCITTNDLDPNTLEFVNGKLQVKSSLFTTQQGTTTSNWATEVAEYMVYDSEMEELQFGIYCYFDGDIESGDDIICGRDFMIDGTENIQDPDGVALFGGKSSSLVASSSVEISVQKILVNTPVADEVIITCESTTTIASGGYLFTIPNGTNNQPIYKAAIGSFVTDGGVNGTIKGTTNGIIDAQIPTGATVYIKVTLFK